MSRCLSLLQLRPLRQVSLTPLRVPVQLCVLLVSSAVAAVATLALRALPEGDHSLDFDESRPASKVSFGN